MTEKIRDYSVNGAMIIGVDNLYSKLVRNHTSLTLF